MIASFKSKRLERFWTKDQTKQVDSRHVDRLDRILSLLDMATAPDDMNVTGLGFHALTGDQAGRYAVRVDKNWRVTFGWSDAGPIDVDYEDYH